MHDTQQKKIVIPHGLQVVPVTPAKLNTWLSKHKYESYEYESLLWIIQEWNVRNKLFLKFCDIYIIMIYTQTGDKHLLITLS